MTGAADQDSDTTRRAKAVLEQVADVYDSALSLVQAGSGWEVYCTLEVEPLVVCDTTQDLLDWATVMLKRGRRAVRERLLGISRTSPTKSRRGRPPDPAVADRRSYLVRLTRRLQPATVRQIFYAASVAGKIEKTEQGYRQIQNDLVLLRREKRIPYGWLADSTRWQRKPDTFTNIEAALAETAAFYRKSLWQNTAAYCEIWLEKDALSGVIYPITSQYDVPLMVSRGYSSLSFLHSAAEALSNLTVPAFIYHLGDYDPSGQDAARAIEKSLLEMAPDADITFSSIAVTPTQIAEWKLPTRPTKMSDTRAAKFGSDTSVELDAIPPDSLRKLVEDCILDHLPETELEVLRVAEQSERSVLRDLVKNLRGAA